MSLVERIEGARGPDTAIDAEIHAAVNDAHSEWQDYRKGYAFYRGNTYISLGLIPAYTASIDAALTLVPEGWGLSIEQERPTRDCEASISAPGGEPWGSDSFNATAATLALALCAAALRAREASNG